MQRASSLPNLLDTLIPQRVHHIPLSVGGKPDKLSVHYVTYDGSTTRLRFEYHGLAVEASLPTRALRAMTWEQLAVHADELFNAED